LICAGRWRSTCRSTTRASTRRAWSAFGKERLVFERSLELASELGLIGGEGEQIVDSTPMLGAAAVQDTATLVRSGVRRLLDVVEAADGEAAEALASGLRFDYSRPRESPLGTGTTRPPARRSWPRLQATPSAR
jgi:hypothetical protein